MITNILCDRAIAQIQNWLYADVPEAYKGLCVYKKYARDGPYRVPSRGMASVYVGESVGWMLLAVLSDVCAGASGAVGGRFGVGYGLS
jgi:hypothetical protein